MCFFVSNINERNVYYITLPNTCIKSNNIKQSQFPLKKKELVLITDLHMMLCDLPFFVHGLNLVLK